MRLSSNIKNIDCINKIDITVEYIEKTWKSFILCKFDDGMKYFGKIMIELDEIILYISNINSESNINLKIKKILKILQELEKTIIIKDYVCSADLLKYEIEPILKEWKNFKK
ncbi:hypothetical protein [Clostridium tyrobutyricum]|uniref:hypothetical protein n=1 Tax=Clostridium tyrobutyricum TaxID=1519 RepID=UPI0010AA595C|nr:hypothetical protein [Clostridium tyrobutyricum]QCH26960.1 hypothetical protein EZN00_00549 [Clostridium tyrobutyricum]